jgi:hypothetical protein
MPVLTFATKFSNVEDIIFASCTFANIECLKVILLKLEYLKRIEIHGAELTTATDVLMDGGVFSGRSIDYFKYRQIDHFKGSSFVNNNTSSWKLLKVLEMSPSIHVKAIDFELLIDRYELVEIKEIINFLWLYQTSLKRLSCDVTLHKYFIPLMKTLSKMKNLRLEHFSTDELSNNYNNEFSMLLQQQRQLISFGMTVNTTRDQLEAIGEHLTNLTHLELTFQDMQHYNEVLQVVMAQLPKLKVFKLKPIEPVSLEFEIPKNLEELIVYADAGVSYNMCPSKLKLIASDHCLKDMKKFSLLNIRISSNRLQEVFAKMPNLEYFQLSDMRRWLPAKALTGHTIYGVQPYSLKSLKKLKYLCLDTYFMKNYVLMDIQAPELREFCVTYESDSKKRVICNT